MLCHCGDQVEEGQTECGQCKSAMDDLMARVRYKSEQNLISHVRYLLQSHKVEEANSLLGEPSGACALALSSVVNLTVDNRIGAIRNLAKAIDIYPNWDAVLLLAELQRRAGQIEDAYATLRKGLTEGDKDNVDKVLRAYDQLTILLIKERKWVEALEIYDDFRIGLREKIMDEIVTRVRCFHADSGVNRASRERELVNFPVEVNKSLNMLATLFNNMGTCFAGNGKFDDARRLFLRSIEFTPPGCDQSDTAMNLAIVESSGSVETRNLGHRILSILPTQPLNRKKSMRVRFVFFNQPYKLLGIPVPLSPDGTESIEVYGVT